MEKQNKWVIDSLVHDFEHHLLEVHGVSIETNSVYSRYVRRFLRTTFRGPTVDLALLHPTHLISFVIESACRYKPKTSKLISNSLRSFIRFLQVRGMCDAQLLHAVPAVHCWRHSDLPRSLTDTQVEQLLASFDQSTADGMRNYAILRFMVDLGLRCREVTSLLLEDIDWRKGIVQISTTKSRRTDLLPLPNLVGQALAEYLSRGRPPTDTRQVFVRHRPPVGEPLGRSGVKAMVRKAFHRAAIETASAGTHTLRHTTATRMMTHGATLKEIADVLRHRHIDTTAIYAKVNLPLLREVAIPWPEV